MTAELLCGRCGAAVPECACGNVGTAVWEIPRPEPNRLIVEYLRNALAHAEAGEITSLALAAVLTGRRTLRSSVIGELGAEHAQLLGVIELVRFDVASKG